MIRSLKSLTGVRIQAIDGGIGKTEDFFFNSDKWTVRYVVVTTGGWLVRNKVLISPISITKVTDQTFEVNLTKVRIEKSPDIDTDKPVSRQREIDYYNYYNWPYYWRGAGAWGVAPAPGGLDVFSEPKKRSKEKDELSEQEKGDPNLRSFASTRDYRVAASDDIFGHVEDLLMDDINWNIKYAVVDTVSWWPSKTVLLPSKLIKSISWDEVTFITNLLHKEVQDAPEFHPQIEISPEYLASVEAYYEKFKNRLAA